MECYWREWDGMGHVILGVGLCEYLAVEVEQRGSSVEIVAGLSKKKKIWETVSDEEKSTNTTNRERWRKWGV